VSQRSRRRNFFRRVERRALYRAWRQGERYCFACGGYRPPHAFTGVEQRICDHCRGQRHCQRCRQDQPVADFGAAGYVAAADDTCRTCRSYRPLSAQERAQLKALLTNDEDAEPVDTGRGVALGRDASGRRVWLPAAARLRHLCILGQPGSGKRSLLKQLAIQDMAAGQGCGVVDVHGDVAFDLLGSIPAARLPVVTYFAPATGHGPTFNPLALPYPPQVIVDDLVDAFAPFFIDGWDAHLEQLLRFGLLTLLGDRAPHTLADLYTLYVAPTYRNALAEASPSPRLRAFWQHELPRTQPGAVERIADTLAAFLTPLSPLERLFSIAENGVDFKALMDGRHIFIASLSEDALGREPARLLAAFLFRPLARAARARAEHGQPADFFLYLPEFQDCATPVFPALSADFTRARVNLTVAQQRLSEPPVALGDEILATVGSLVVFRIGTDDAERLQREMHTRRLARASTGQLYDHDAVRRAAAAPLRTRARELQAGARVFAEEDAPTYVGSHVDALCADIGRLRSLPLPDDLIEIDWPALTDFTERTPLSALVRIQQPDHLNAFTLEPLPLPDVKMRAKILERPHRREPLPRHAEAKSAAAPAHFSRDGQKPRRRRRWRGAIRTLRRPAR
jgi:hypothetical protein